MQTFPESGNFDTSQTCCGLSASPDSCPGKVYLTMSQRWRVHAATSVLQVPQFHELELNSDEPRVRQASRYLWVDGNGGTEMAPACICRDDQYREWIKWIISLVWGTLGSHGSEDFERWSRMQEPFSRPNGAETSRVSDAKPTGRAYEDGLHLEFE